MSASESVFAWPPTVSTTTSAPPRGLRHLADAGGIVAEDGVGAERLRHRLLVRVARRRGDVRRAHRLRGGDRHQSDRAGAEHRDAVAEADIDEAQPVHGDGERLAQRAEFEVDLGGQLVAARTPATCMYSRRPPVVLMPFALRTGAEVVVAGAALRAREADVEQLQRDAVTLREAGDAFAERLDLARALVAEDEARRHRELAADRSAGRCRRRRRCGRGRAPVRALACGASTSAISNGARSCSVAVLPSC